MELVKIEAPELNVIESSKAEQIRAVFLPMATMLQEFEDDYNEVLKEAESEITKAVTTKAKSLRIKIGKVRIETEKTRKEQKEEYLRAGKAIDGVSNILKWAVTDKEDKLKEIENHFELLEKKKKEELQEKRVEELSPYVEGAAERDLSSMEQDVWEAYLSAKVKEYNDRLEAEKKAEAERVAKEKAEAEERDRIAKENERLKKEAEAREKAAKKEAEKKAKEEAERKAKEESERKAREEAERKKQAEHEAELKAEREAREKVEREEREKREKLEAELKAKEESERKAREEAERKLQADLNKGDAEKFEDLKSSLKEISSKYEFKAAKNQRMYEDVKILIGKVITHIEQKYA